MTIGSLDALAGALGATLVVDLRWRGADLDRLIDRLHAEVQEAAASRLTRAGWLVRAEVTFNHYGDRGACDLVALHPATGVLAVVEVKSRLGNVQGTLHRLDTKARLGGLLAQQLGWPRPTSVARALVLAAARLGACLRGTRPCSPRSRSGGGRRRGGCDAPPPDGWASCGSRLRRMQRTAA